MLSKLTICIPTYNRGPELKEALESIKNILGGKVSVAISDNASDDCTQQLCKEVADNNYFYKFQYHRNPVNVGADANYQKVVSLADTEYCMILGSDDTLAVHSVTLISRAIENDLDIAIFGRNNFDRTLTKFYSKQTFWKKNSKKLYNLSDRAIFAQYIENCTSIAGLFSYLSCFIFKRQVWVEDKKVNDVFFGTAYSHVASLVNGIIKRSNTKLQHFEESIVNCRLGNDSFLTENVVDRYIIDWDGYEKIDDFFYRDYKPYFCKVLRGTNTFYDLLALRYHLTLQNKEDDIQKVTCRLKEADWGATPAMKWHLTGFIPKCLLKTAYKYRTKFR